MNRRTWPTKDPKEAELRARWYATLEALSEKSGSREIVDHTLADRALTDYLWKRTQADIEEDRRKHPKAKRNQGVPKGIEVGSGRVLP